MRFRDGGPYELADRLHAPFLGVLMRNVGGVVRSESRTTAAVARVLLGLATSWVIVGAFTPLDPLGPRGRQSPSA
jgi:hypothetical protein